MLIQYFCTKMMNYSSFPYRCNQLQKNGITHECCHYMYTMVYVVFIVLQVSFKKEPKPVNICGICADRAKTSFFIPCGHSICAPCAVFIEESETKLCPFCKIEFVKVGTLFD